MSLSRALRGPLRLSSRSLRAAAVRAADDVEQVLEWIDGAAARAGIGALADLLAERGTYVLGDGGAPGVAHIRRSSDGEIGAWAMYGARSGLYVVGAFSGAVGVASDVFEAAELVPGYGPTSLTALRWSQEWADFQAELDYWRQRLYGGEK
ncbi:hypothetical protein HerbRD11066_78270 [Herbidospora sp. RD11066]